jgi:hypothetical protein
VKIRSELMNGLTWDARLSTAPTDTLAGHPVLVLDNEEILSPEDATFGEFSLVEATAEEREALRQAGYSLPDWTPGQQSA